MAVNCIDDGLRFFTVTLLFREWSHGISGGHGAHVIRPLKFPTITGQDQHKQLSLESYWRGNRPCIVGPTSNLS